MKPKILSLGEVIWDVYPHKSTLGGAPLNFAAHVALCGAESTLISAVGRDSLGEKALEALGTLGVNRQYVAQNGFATGQCLVTLDEEGIPHYRVLREVSYDHILLEDEELEEIAAQGFDALYFGTLIQRSEDSRASLARLLKRCQFSHILCDVNLRPDCYDRDSVELCLWSATVLKVSLEEEPLMRALVGYEPLAEDPLAIARAICKAYANIEVLLLTMGEEGALAYIPREEECYRQVAAEVEVVSTVGAGDSFAAAWLTAYLWGEPMEICLRRAARLSGYVVSRTEAVPKDLPRSIFE